MNNSWRRILYFLANVTKRYAIMLVLIGLMIVFSIINPRFFSFGNFVNIMAQNSYIIIASMGMAFAMIGGGIDLSIGYAISLIGVVTTVLMKWGNFPVWSAIIGGLALGTLLGFFNGFLSVKLKVHTMIVTLGTMSVFEGISYTITNSNSIYDLSSSFKFIGQGYVFGVPLSIIITVIIAILATLFLSKTYLGRYIYAVGSNEEASRLAGINTNQIRVAIFSICGLFVGIAAVILVARSGSMNSSVGAGTEFVCLTAAILGGVSFKGGEGKIWSVGIGALILGVLSNGMQIIGLGIYPQYIAKGFILLAAISFDTYQRQTKVKKLITQKVEVNMMKTVKSDSEEKLEGV